MKEVNNLIIKQETGIINQELFKKHFGFQMLNAMQKAMHNTNSKNKNKDSVISDLTNKIEEMPENDSGYC